MRPILCFVLDRSATRLPLRNVVAAAVRAGVDWIQIRDRELDSLALLAHTRDVSAAARRAASESGRAVQILVNRRSDVALAVDADGVHLGGDALSPVEARALLGEQARIGCSTHSVEEVARARRQGCDYVHLAPIYDPLSKPAQRPALGLGAIEAASAHAIPVIAQGGLAPEHCRAVLAAGARGIAVTGSIALSDHPGEAAARLRDALDG